IVSELLEHPLSAQRTAQAALMDTLSLGVTFRAVEVIYRLEAAVTYEREVRERDAEVDKKLLFTSIPDHLGDGLWTFPAGCRPSQVAAMIEGLRTRSEYRSVRGLAEMSDINKLHQDHREAAEKYVRLMTASIARLSSLRCGGRIDRERILLAERVS